MCLAHIRFLVLKKDTGWIITSIAVIGCWISHGNEMWFFVFGTILGEGSLCAKPEGGHHRGTAEGEV